MTRPIHWTFVVLLVIGVGSILNGLLMCFDTVRWFGLVAVDTGALNPHLVRDVGSAYISAGTALVWAAWRPAFRAPLTAVAAIFMMLHALWHVYETATGLLPFHHWLEDAPGVHLPALVLTGMAIAFARQREDTHAT